MIMRTSTWRLYALAAGFVALASPALMRAQSAAADPWSRVPSLPTACYYDHADFERFDNAYMALVAETARQKKINDDLQNQLNSMDGMVKAQKMQAFMMKNPQKAMEVMQAMQAGAVTATNTVQTSSTEGPKLDQELEALHVKFRAEITSLIKPIDDRAAAFANAHSKPGEAGYVFTSKADEAQYHAIVKERNAAYDKVCASWWGANGQVHAWFGRYKTLLVNEAQGYDANSAAIVTQMQILDAPSGGYRSTYSFEAASRYLERARSIFQNRPGTDVSTGWLR